LLLSVQLQLLLLQRALAGSGLALGWQHPRQEAQQQQQHRLNPRHQQSQQLLQRQSLRQQQGSSSSSSSSITVGSRQGIMLVSWK
jgi:hypothetical protein